MRIDLHIHVHQDPRVDELLRLVRGIATTEITIMGNTKDLLDKVAAQTTVVDSAVALLNHLSEIIANGGSTADVQAAIDGVTANTVKLADAIAANTPAQ
jgi:hypothetical protein